jgi:hypothetical protein
LILLGTIIAFPEEASAVLLALGDLVADTTPEERTWSDYLEEVRSMGTRFVGVAQFLEGVSDSSQWTCEPFRRWALEVSRYSFATGQEVFSHISEQTTPTAGPNRRAV